MAYRGFGFALTRTRRNCNICDDIDGIAANLSNLLSPGNCNEIAKASDSE